MRLFKKTKTKTLIAFALSLVFAVSLMQLFKISYAKANTEVEGPTYIETEVKNIRFQTVASTVVFGFELTVSDYTVGLGTDMFNGDPEDETHKAFAEYILNLTYWKNFRAMNSEGSIFVQIFTYFNCGSDLNVLGPIFSNTVANRSDLKFLEYGFTITFPKGTTFPSYEYVSGGCKGEMIAYKTVKEQAFYFDGEGFSVLPYEVALLRENAIAEIEFVNYTKYNAEEREQVKALVNQTILEIKGSFSEFAIQEVLENHYANLEKIMTKEDYADLEDKKESAKTEISTFLNGFVESDYDEIEWNKIAEIKAETQSLIDSLKSIEEIESAVKGIKNSVNSLIKKQGKQAFESYKAEVLSRFENSFDGTLYLEEEKTIGLSLIEEGANLIRNALTYGEVDAIEGAYLARLSQLKTREEREEESKNESVEEIESNVGESTPNSDNPSSDLTIVLIITSACVALIAICVVTLLFIKKKQKGAKNED